MAYYRKIDKNGNLVPGDGLIADFPPGGDYVETHYVESALHKLTGLGVESYDTFVNDKNSSEHQNAMAFAKDKAERIADPAAAQRKDETSTASVNEYVAGGGTYPPQQPEDKQTYNPAQRIGQSTLVEVRTNGGPPHWVLATGSPPLPAPKRVDTLEDAMKLRAVPTSSFSTSELGPVAAQLKREEAEAAITAAALKVQTDAAAARITAEARLRVDNAAILKGEEETARAKTNEEFLINKDAYARSVDNVKLQREAQSELFKQQTEIARLTAEQVNLVARRDESQASLDQAVNLANLSAEQRGKEFNVTQEFNVQRANEEAARARQQQLQTLGTDIGKLGADSGDRGKYAATILANSGWGQADRALAGANMNTTASLSPLEALLRQRETVQNLSDKPYTYNPTTISTAARTQMGPVDFSRMQMPTAQPLAAFTSPGRYVPTTQTTAQPPNAAPASSGASTSAPSAGSSARPANQWALDLAANPQFNGSGAGTGATGTGTRPSYGALSDPGDMGGVRTDAAYVNSRSGADALYDTGDTGGVRTDAAYVNSLAASGEAYGTKGTKEREFITGDPQRNGKPNPELVRVNNPGPDTRVEVIPLQGNGDMNMTSMYAEGTDTGLMTADGRKRNPLEVLQMLMKNGVDPQKAMDMVKALGFDAETGGWKPENKASEPVAKPVSGPMPTGPEALFTEGASEGNPRAKVSAKRGVDEGVTDGVRVDEPLGSAPRTKDDSVTGGSRLVDMDEDQIMHANRARAAKAAPPIPTLMGYLSRSGGKAKNVGQGSLGPMISYDEPRYAYGTEGDNSAGAGDGLNLIMAALQNNPAALAAFMALIGQGQEAPSFPA